MEVNPGVPQNHFDLVLSIYGLGWTTDLGATLALVNTYLRPGGCLVVSGEHPVYSCLSGTEHSTRSQYPTSPRGPANTRRGRVCRLLFNAVLLAASSDRSSKRIYELKRSWRHQSILRPRTRVTPIPRVGTLFLGQA
jgi:hypothetical protein